MAGSTFDDDGTSFIGAIPPVLQQQYAAAQGFDLPQPQQQLPIMARLASNTAPPATPAPLSPQRALTPQRPSPSLAPSNMAAAAALLLQSPAAPAQVSSPGAGALTAPGLSIAPSVICTAAEGAPTAVQADGGPDSPAAHGCSDEVLLAVGSATADADATAAAAASSISLGLLRLVPPSAAIAIPWPAFVAAPKAGSGGAEADAGIGAAAMGAYSGARSPPDVEATMSFLRQSLMGGTQQQAAGHTGAASGDFRDLGAPEAAAEAGARLPPALTAQGDAQPAAGASSDGGAAGVGWQAPSVPPAVGTAPRSPRAASSSRQPPGTSGVILDSLTAVPAAPGGGSRSRPARGYGRTSGGEYAEGERWSPSGVLAGMMSRFQRLSHGSHQHQEQHQQQQLQRQLQQQHTSQTLTGLRSHKQRAANTVDGGAGGSLRSPGAAARLFAGAAGRGVSGAASYTAADGAVRLLSGASANALLAAMGSPSSPHARTAGGEMWRQPAAQPPPLSTGSPLRSLIQHLRVPVQGVAGGSGGSLGSLEVQFPRPPYTQHQSSSYHLQQSARPPSGGPAAPSSTRRLPIKAPSAAFLGSMALGHAVGKTRMALRRTSSAAKLLIRTAAGAPGHQPQAPGAAEAPLQGSTPRANTASGLVAAGGPPAASGLPSATGIGSPTRGRSLSSMGGAGPAGGGGPTATSSIRMRLSMQGSSARGAASLTAGGAAGGGGVEAEVSVAAAAAAVTFGELLRLQWCVQPAGARGNAHQQPQKQRRSVGGAPGGATTAPPIRKATDLSIASSAVTDDVMQPHSRSPAGWTAERLSAAAQQYSGALLRLAKAVSDVGQGGMILLSQATRDALQQAAEGESPAALQKALGGPFVVLWMGKHTFADGAGDVHLYQVVSMPLLGRLALQLQQQEQQALLRKCTPVPPLGGGVFDAPAAGVGTLARISVVGAPTLMAWNAEVTTRALALMHEMLLGHLTRCLSATCEAVVEEEEPNGLGGGMGPPELLEHPLAEEAWFDGPEGQQQPGRPSGLHWRGLRATGVVAWGELAGCLEPGSLSGHMSYQHSAAWQALKRTTAASQVGQVVVSSDVAAMLPPEQLDRVVVAKQGPTSRKTKRG
ncbi:hypothetical protein HXX76_007312 [Chlamydomonas incerta]|uniref:Uncharacterized protein n=1 Tax=Chlamydomonas incerta TaxID=51695 RepID=A0A835TC20_CHLIN|nr:hypothetical protein HXX76_007312 [Chlamydomonas incerta]|eukprot:KAG2435230.1 hypothetical protein HXX76_007312 [Chlamydomonas incerta]